MSTEFESFEHLWRVDNFASICLESNENIMSPVFSDPSGRTRWFGEFYPNGYGEDDEKFLAVILHRDSPLEPSMDLVISISLLGTCGSRFYTSILAETLHKYNTYIGEFELVLRQSVLDQASVLLPNGHLTIIFEVRIPNDSDYKEPKSLPPCKLSMMKMIRENMPHDVVLVANGTQVKAHRLVLSAVSPVLANMLAKVDKKEKSTKVQSNTPKLRAAPVDFSHLFDFNPFAGGKTEEKCKEDDAEDVDHMVMNDIEPTVLSKMVDYLYLDGKLGWDKMSIETCGKLLGVAIQYQINPLRQDCEHYLASILKVPIATEILLIAEQHGASKLYAHTIDFLRNRAARIFKTKSWITALQQNPSTVQKVLTAMANVEFE